MPILHGFGKLNEVKLHLPPRRPVVPVIGSSLFRTGRWVVTRLKYFLTYLQTCAKNLDDLIEILTYFKRAVHIIFVSNCNSEAMRPSSQIEEGLAFLILRLDTCALRENLVLKKIVTIVN